jgi:putative ABC transport system substrate-binding protein
VIRRGFIALAATLSAWPLSALAQREPKTSRIGFLGHGAAAANVALMDCWTEGLRQAGRQQGRDYVVDYRWANGVTERLPELVAELIKLRPDVLVTYSTPAAQAAKRATKGIPIIFTAVSDPVASGVVASLGRPGGNVTGVSNFLPATTPKLLELLKAVHPITKRVEVLHDPTNAGKLLEVKELGAAGSSLGIQTNGLGVRNADDVERAFASIARTRPNALVVLQDAVTLRHRDQITKLAANAKLPAIYQIREHVHAGGLMSYGLNYCDHFRRAASYVDRILKGMKPADLPVELPTRFELVINMKTARSVGVDIPPAVLLQADALIE